MSIAWHASTLLASAAPLDLAKAVVVAPAGLSGPEKKAVAVLREEVEKRTQILFPVTDAWPAEQIPVITVGPASLVEQVAGSYASLLAAERGEIRPEGYRIRTVTDRVAPAMLVVGNDARGVLFGVGHVLRLLHMAPRSVRLVEALNISTAPRYPLRGHQLGYRPKTNSYDAWTVSMWEQYIRDLAVFGTNAIELIPPRSDDDDDSPHFPLPKIEMMVEMSRIADEYGLDVWIWYPALDKDYADPKTVALALEEWDAVFQKLPRIDAIFVPGGDPGHTQPKYLFALLEQATKVLHQSHPEAQMWMSPQSFNQEWMEEFYQLMQQEPAWLTGIVFGPQVRVSLPELRAAVPERYPIRRYPDITHSLHSQYPVPDWDTAYALTEGREGINPRPLGQAVIFRTLQSYATGFLTYSEGCNDDVNKFVWSGLGWDPDAEVLEILRQYSRFFIGDQSTDDFAQGLLALEQNWAGPLLTNAGVYTTLEQFQAMERSASPQVLLNWRFQQALYRAYYDAYNRSRLLYETALEDEAMDRLRQAPRTGSLLAMEQAEAALGRAVTHPVAQSWRARVFELAEALYQSVRMQLSVPRYKAIAVRRGANLDEIDVPLNNAPWLADRSHEIRKMAAEDDRLRALDEIVNWTNPGPGGFYDDLGSLASQTHLVRGLGFEKDPAFLRSSLVGFGLRTTHPWRYSWRNHAESLNDEPLEVTYAGLDPTAQYKVRVVYAGEPVPGIRLVANDRDDIHPFIEKEIPVRPQEFDIPRDATSGGTLTLTWYRTPGLGGAGRGCQVAEVWLIKQ
ncbi:MAG: hypothetical protein GEU99_20350 [Luteitalea sp.]|nr:hypothetical protein [Luteitalea sp.]